MFPAPKQRALKCSKLTPARTAAWNPVTWSFELHWALINWDCPDLLEPDLSDTNLCGRDWRTANYVHSSSFWPSRTYYPVWAIQDELQSENSKQKVRSPQRLQKFLSSWEHLQSCPGLFPAPTALEVQRFTVCNSSSRWFNTLICLCGYPFPSPHLKIKINPYKTES